MEKARRIDDLVSSLPKCDSEPAQPSSLKQEVGMRRGFEIICLEPSGFSTREVQTIRQAMCQVEMLLETGATKIGIYALKVEAHPNDQAQARPE